MTDVVYTEGGSVILSIDDKAAQVVAEDKKQTVEATCAKQPVEVAVRSIDIITVGLQGPAGVAEDAVPYDKETDVSADGLTIYIGEASPGSLTAAAVWRIKRIVFNAEGDSSTTWADGNASFDNVWDDRLSLTYGP